MLVVEGRRRRRREKGEEELWRGISGMARPSAAAAPHRFFAANSASSGFSFRVFALLVSSCGRGATEETLRPASESAPIFSFFSAVPIFHSIPPKRLRFLAFFSPILLIRVHVQTRRSTSFALRFFSLSFAFFLSFSLCPPGFPPTARPNEDSHMNSISGTQKMGERVPRMSKHATDGSTGLGHYVNLRAANRPCGMRGKRRAGWYAERRKISAKQQQHRRRQHNSLPLDYAIFNPAYKMHVTGMEQASKPHPCPSD
ncbi:unnamed protein product [Bursaphelenchus xylophilus]|uniref:(pine wood nematode) hypothetical protein n=1 Tax=Bursaphelenchus xylophilus TaxID=6326 RepID=A0A1I7SR93_BURXY|nr:unnamed protein product [Bursaphelenchus xylophilus]CAG9111006.1 unnamed protein product [Bursaphelenchus xylophilus]